MPEPTPAHGTENPIPLSASDRRRVAVYAGCDPGAVLRYTLGKPVRSTTIERIEAGLRRCALEHVIAFRGRLLTR